MVLYPNKLPESERVCSGICIKWYGETIGETASASIASTTKVNLDM